MSTSSSLPVAITIKTHYGSDIRRFTFDEAKHAGAGVSLFAVIQSAIAASYHLAAKPFSITYTDDEGDHCAIGGDEETREALRFAGEHGRLLKLMIVVSDAASATAKAVSSQQAAAAATPLPLLVAEPATPRATPFESKCAPSSAAAVEVKKVPSRAAVGFVGDGSIEDGSVQIAGATIIKSWSIKNVGDEAWPPGIRLVAAKQLDVSLAELPSNIAANEVITITVPFTVPMEEGAHRMEYQLLCGDGQPVDNDYRLWVSVVVRPSLSAEFVSDVSIPDGTSVAPNITMKKVWSIRNNGTAAWPTGSLLVHNDGTVLPSPLFDNEYKGVLVPAALPSETVSISTHIVAPGVGGRAHGEWHLVAPDGKKFSNDYALWTQLNVEVPTLSAAEVISQLPNWLEVASIRAAVDKLRAPVTASVATSTTSSTSTASTSTEVATSTSSEVATSSSTASVSSGEVVHEGISCDGCGVTPIRGLRYKCTKCDDFDYCDVCEASQCSAGTARHPANHVFIKIKVPLPSARPAAAAVPRRAPATPSRSDSKSNWRAAAAAPVAAAAASAMAKKASPPKSEFKADLTLPDGSQVETGSIVTKRWSVINNGNEQWPRGVQLMFVGGALQPAAPSDTQPRSVCLVPLAHGGMTVEVWARIQVPKQAGRHTGYFRLATAEGKRFGHRLWLDVVAVTAPAAAAAAAATITATPTAAVVAPTVTSLSLSSSPARATPLVRADVAASVAPVTATAAAAAATPRKYQVAIEQLRGMGYKDEDMLNELLSAADGSVQQVIEWLTNPIV